MDSKRLDSRGVIYEPAMVHIRNTSEPKPSWTPDGWCVTVARKFVNSVFPRSELHALHPRLMCPTYMEMVFHHFAETEMTPTSGWDVGSPVREQTTYYLWQLFLSDLGDLLFPMNHLHSMKRMLSVVGGTNTVCRASSLAQNTNAHTLIMRIVHSLIICIVLG